MKAESVEQVIEAVEAQVGHSFQVRESEFWGDYWSYDAEGLELRVISQPDPHGELHEDDFPSHRILIYVDGDIDVPGIDGLATPVGTIERLRETHT